MPGWYRSWISIRNDPLSVLLLLALAQTTGDTVRIGSVQSIPEPAAVEAAALGAPQIGLELGGASAPFWLLRSADTVLVLGWVPDATPSWSDEVVVSLHLEGAAAATPQHEDFQWVLRRSLDSSVVLRGRGGHWEPPRSDPDWRLGPDHSGGGWTVATRELAAGWWVILRLEGPWLPPGATPPPRFAVRLRDSEASAWAAWPSGKAHPSEVEASPQLWGVVEQRER